MLKLEPVKLEIPKAEEILKDLSVSLGIDAVRMQLDDLNAEVGVNGFWDDIDRAQERMKVKRQLEKKLGEYESLAELLSDVQLLVEMADEEDDDELAQEAIEKLAAFYPEAERLRITTLLTDEYDKNNAMVSIHPGTGGTDAQDWAEMLLRMYTRWSDAKAYSVKILDYQRDTEGGIKTVTIMVEGEYAYGYLKAERGVHRLIRISPYNVMNKRQTSFASVDVTPELDDSVVVEINPEDIRIDTFRASGAGGQYVNKTESAIRITHLPTNIVVSCQNERSQLQNKEMAMRMLYAKLYALAKQEKKDAISDLKGNYSQISWGSQIRTYTFQPYTLVKDHRTGAETSDVQGVVDGDIDMFIDAYLNQLAREQA